MGRVFIKKINNYLEFMSKLCVKYFKKHKIKIDISNVQLYIVIVTQIKYFNIEAGGGAKDEF